MNSIEPLGFGEGVTQLTPPTSSENKKQCITIDEILDKINNFGFDSLTDEELDILKSQ
jgi:hypothetical protein